MCYRALPHQHPLDDAAKGTSKKLEFAGQIPRFTQPEIFFLSTLMTDKNSKEVGVGGSGSLSGCVLTVGGGLVCLLKQTVCADRGGLNGSISTEKLVCVVDECVLR